MSQKGDLWKSLEQTLSFKNNTCFCDTNKLHWRDTFSGLYENIGPPPWFPYEENLK